MSRGFGYIEFYDVETAKNAYATLNGSYLDGRSIRLDTAAQRDRPVGGFGGNQGGFGGNRGGFRWGNRGGFRGNNSRDPETQLSYSVKMTRMKKQVLLVLSKVKKSLSELVQIDLNIMFIYLFYISFLIIVKSLW